MRDPRTSSGAVQPTNLPWFTLRTAEERQLIEQHHPDGADKLVWFDRLIEGTMFTIDATVVEASEAFWLRPGKRFVAGYDPNDLERVDFMGPGGHQVIYQRTGVGEGVLYVVVFDHTIPDWVRPMMEAANLMPSEMV